MKQGRFSQSQNDEGPLWAGLRRVLYMSFDYAPAHLYKQGLLVRLLLVMLVAATETPLPRRQVRNMAVAAAWCMSRINHDSDALASKILVLDHPALGVSQFGMVKKAEFGRYRKSESCRGSAQPTGVRDQRDAFPSAEMAHAYLGIVP